MTERVALDNTLDTVEEETLYVSKLL